MNSRHAFESTDATGQDTPKQTRRDILRNTGLGLAALGTGGFGTSVLAQSEELSALEKIRKRGRITVGLYQEMPPFFEKSKGIDLDLAKALAAGLGVELSPLPFAAGESMGDDLRNMVWRGHYLGWGPADVLLHVPVDRPLMSSNPQVEIFGPYYRESVSLARKVSDFPEMTSLDQFKGGRIAVPGLSLAGWLLIGAEGGRYREQLTTKLRDGTEAAAALLNGDCVGAAGLHSELESVIAGDERFIIEPLPMPRARQGWPVGMAVKSNAKDLAQALQGTLNQLANSGELKTIFARHQVKWRMA
jgi:ABC-type amino acid transport substrate-binding protein